MRISVHVTPRSRKNEIAWNGEVLNVRLTAPPVDGAANEALIKLLAARLDLPRSALRILQGATGRRKVLEIDGMTSEDARKKLS